MPNMNSSPFLNHLRNHLHAHLSRGSDFGVSLLDLVASLVEKESSQYNLLNTSKCNSQPSCSIPVSSTA